MDLNYRKLRRLDLDSLAKQYEHSPEDLQHDYNPFNVSKLQAFNPLYSDFFVLSESNYDRVGLNHPYYVDGCQISGPSGPEGTGGTGGTGGTVGPGDNRKKFHVKCSPLLDPIHYLVGKYNSVAASSLLHLPTIHNTDECCKKIANKQNASYVDGFFCYLSGQSLHKHNMLNAIDFYGSYLAIQRVFKANITDDVDYLYQSPHFMDHLGKDFSVSCLGSSSSIGFDDFTGIGSRNNKKRLVLEDELSADELGVDIVDIGVVEADFSDAKPWISCEYETERAASSAASASDSESDDDLNYSSSEEEEDGEKEDDCSDASSSQSESDRSESSFVSTESEEQEAYAYIKEFPANLIFLEKCDGTLDRLFMDQKIDCDGGAACLTQIVMALLAFQRAFHFTHNDLHTNNIMYVNTDAEWLYYKYGNQFYRVPTYGRIFKIIDFGRAIYRFKDRVYCSDSFAPKGDAHSQYNTEPYFNAKRARIEPNLSFDLCRLGTSIYDFLIQDESEKRNELQETIYRWCLDDNGKNVMYRRDGEERYPGFKLYKMIAKNVHAHTPQEQLKFEFFSQFRMAPSEAAKLDEQEVRRYGLNIDAIAKEYV